MFYFDILKFVNCMMDIEKTKLLPLIINTVALNNATIYTL